MLIASDQAARYELKAPDGATGLRSLALDTRHGPRRKVRVPTDPTRVRGVEYLSRAARGADEKLRFKADGTENSPNAFCPFQTITVHHTAWTDSARRLPPRAAEPILARVRCRSPARRVRHRRPPW
ncbi:hypothetical protein ACFZCL_14805 [Streptomyces sp. NPDC008159]|uniref:hypothetical protein n=1 Tax=Streptomyces sp. NPDC008159 TaxID=3364817 RepID=UPI0036E405B0